jgi:nucleoside-diphosphate-sugar epimerase
LTERREVQLIEGDVRSFEWPKNQFDFTIHMAGAIYGPAFANDIPLQQEIISEGTRNVIAFSKKAGVHRVLFISSGAVYGPQPAGANISEDLERQSDSVSTREAYGHAKRVAETIVLRSELNVVIARPFTFVGPSLPLKGPFAIGNFLRDALNGNSIHVHGDGMGTRSYLYAADLAVWLWKLLIRGHAGRAYNVGSDQPIRIIDLAHQIAKLAKSSVEVAVARSSSAPPSDYYIPSIERAKNELGLRVYHEFADGLNRTWQWLLASGTA